VDVGWSDAHNAWFVRDNGVGLDLEKADRVFDTFRRMHSHADFEGTGIGLALVRRAIERHQGKIWIQSKPDQGATFYFALGEQSNVETC
jgi:light-regulated signal transduction histidine kinase (bacteriophytochrome)